MDILNEVIEHIFTLFR